LTPLSRLLSIRLGDFGHSQLHVEGADQRLFGEKSLLDQDLSELLPGGFLFLKGFFDLLRRHQAEIRQQLSDRDAFLVGADDFSQLVPGDELEVDADLSQRHVDLLLLLRRQGFFQLLARDEAFLHEQFAELRLLAGLPRASFFHHLSCSIPVHPGAVGVKVPPAPPFVGHDTRYRPGGSIHAASAGLLGRASQKDKAV